MSLSDSLDLSTSDSTISSSGTGFSDDFSDDLHIDNSYGPLGSTTNTNKYVYIAEYWRGRYAIGMGDCTDDEHEAAMIGKNLTPIIHFRTDNALAFYNYILDSLCRAGIPRVMNMCNGKPVDLFNMTLSHVIEITINMRNRNVW
jgi:hypothetical protein